MVAKTMTYPALIGMQGDFELVIKIFPNIKARDAADWHDPALVCEGDIAVPLLCRLVDGVVEGLIAGEWRVVCNPYGDEAQVLGIPDGQARLETAIANHGDTLLTMMREQSIAAMADRDEGETYGISLDDDGVPSKYRHGSNDGYIAAIDDRVIWSVGSSGNAWSDVFAAEIRVRRDELGDDEYEPTNDELLDWAEEITRDGIADGLLSLDELRAEYDRNQE